MQPWTPISVLLVSLMAVGCGEALVGSQEFACLTDGDCLGGYAGRPLAAR